MSEDPIERQLQERMKDIRELPMDCCGLLPMADDLARECAALRRLCLEVTEYFSLRDWPRRSALLAKLTAAAEGKEVGDGS